jgi:hypothetical protein
MLKAYESEQQERLKNQLGDKQARPETYHSTPEHQAQLKLAAQSVQESYEKLKTNWDRFQVPVQHR